MNYQKKAALVTVPCIVCAQPIPAGHPGNAVNLIVQKFLERLEQSLIKPQPAETPPRRSRSTHSES